MAAISKEVRRLLDDNGCDYVRILASGSYDEHKIAQVLAAGAMIDSFAVGTRMGVSADAPYFDIAYKLVKYAGRPVMKLSTGKVTLVDKKQVYRYHDGQGMMDRDVIARRDEAVAGGEPRLKPVMRRGGIIRPQPDLHDSRKYFQAQFARLPEPYKALEEPPSYPVALSPGLRDLQSRVERQLQARLFRRNLS